MTHQELLAVVSQLECHYEDIGNNRHPHIPYWTRCGPFFGLEGTDMGVNVINEQAYQGLQKLRLKIAAEMDGSEIGTR